MRIFLADKDGNVKMYFSSKWRACAYILDKHSGVVDVKRDFEKLLKEDADDQILYTSADVTGDIASGFRLRS